MTNTFPTKIYEVLKKVVNGDIDNYKVIVNDTNKKGEGYLGQIFFISLQEKNNGKQLNFVIKQAFAENNIRGCFPIRDVFLNEINFYRKVWPKLSKFQERIPPEYHFVNLAKCYGAISEENHERLVFQNLKNQGFGMHDKKKPLSMSQFEAIFKAYARLHAISFAYKSLNVEEFSELCGGVQDVWEMFSRKPTFSASIKKNHEICLENFQVGVDDAVIEKYKHYVDDGVELFRKSLVAGKYSCLIHGDCWSNNMMFKYDDSGELIDVKFLDFQLVQLASPICDLSYCLYSGGTKEIFDDLNHLLQVYHGTLSDCLRAYGCDPDEVYPLKAMKDDWKVHSQMGLNMALGLWRGKLTYDDNILDLTDLADDDEGDINKFYATKYDEAMYRKLTRDVLVHFYENGYMY